MTPGLWKHLRAFADNAPDYFVVQTARNSWGKPEIARCHDEDNARAIAALPELLAAAEKLAAWDQSDGDVALISEACSLARLGLMRAKGE